MIVGVHHVEIRSAAANRARDALRVVAGLETVPATAHFVRGPNVYLRIVDGPNIARRPPHAVGWAHVCVQSSNGRAAFAELETHGARFIAPLTDLAGPYLYAYGHLPGGVLFELESTPCAPNGGPEGWFGHIAVVTPDLRALSAFYAALLDKPVTKGGRLSGNQAVDTITGLRDVDVRVCWIHGLNLGLEFWSYAHPDPPLHVDRDAGIHALALESDDLDEDVFRARDLGATICEDESPADVGDSAVLRDPHGNRLRLMQSVPSTHALARDHLAHGDVLARFAASMDRLT